MDEKIIIKSEFLIWKPFRIIIFILCGLVILGTVFTYIVKGTDYNNAVKTYNAQCEKHSEAVAHAEKLKTIADEKLEAYRNAKWSEGKEDLEKEYEKAYKEYTGAYNQMCSLENTLNYYEDDIDNAKKAMSDPANILICVIIIIVLLVVLFLVWLYVKYTMIVITNKRVVKKMLFGRIEIPLDFVASIGRFPFFMITIKSIRGTIRLSWLKNRNELHDVMSDLLVSRQSDLNENIKRNLEI